MQHYDVIIVGAGPGGLRAAKTLGDAGRSVLLLEKNAVIGPKICAGGITLKDLKIGVPADLEGRTYDAMSVYSPSKRKTVIRLPQPFLRTITRHTLGQWMAAQLVHPSMTVRTKAKVTELRNRSVIINGDEEIGFDFLIGADGSISTIRQFLKIPVRNVMSAIQYYIPDHHDEIAFYLDAQLFGPGYAWIFPHAQSTSIGAAKAGYYKTRWHLKESLDRWMAKWGIDVGASKLEGWTINYDYRGHEFGRVFLIGDAAGFTSGLTGEGIYFAMVSGEEIAKKILDPNYPTPEITRLLKIKRTHERLLKLLESRWMQRLVHELAVLSTRHRRIAEKAVELFG